MSKPTTITVDGNEAVALVAHKINEVIAIYPITPSSPMGEFSDLYSSKGQKNIFGSVPEVFELQSEGGASGTVHGALQAGSLTTTFTASQGLLLMIPNMYKIAGELTATVFHVAARSLAAQGLSIFGDHQDVMGVRQTGFALLASNSVQEAHDFALISQAATLRSRIPFLHFFDGFRTSHEVSRIEKLSDEVLKKMIDSNLVAAHRRRGLSPDHPVLRGTAQNPDVYFQGRESVNRYYQALPEILQGEMDRFSALTGRSYHLFDYVGAADASRVIVLMGSGAEAVEESVTYLIERGESVGLIKVRLALPFAAEAFIAALPASVQAIGVLDRTKEPGSTGEPLYHDVVTALFERGESLPFKMPRIVGGRYGLSSKEFTPAMIFAIYDELSNTSPKNHFTIGIDDDITLTSLEYDHDFILKNPDQFQAIFYGLGSDGTVGANKNTIKIIGTETDHYAQGYFVYDSKKSGSMTTSHLRFGTKPIKSSYLIQKADFVAVHQSVFLEKLDLLDIAKEGGIFLLNTPYSKEEVWSRLPRVTQERIIEKKLKFYAIDAYKVAHASNMGRRINTVMQTCFFAISGILSKEEAMAKIKGSIQKTYGSKGDVIVQMNYAAVDTTLENLYEIDVPARADSLLELQATLKGDMSEFTREVIGKITAFKGDTLRVSQIPDDGTWPTGTTQYEKRNIAQEVPVWDADTCIQCNKCVSACPHSVIRSSVFDISFLKNAPAGFSAKGAKGKNFGENEVFNISVAIEDCTGCALCVEVCPAKNKSQTNLKAINMVPQLPLREEGIAQWDFFLSLPKMDRGSLDPSNLKESQFLEPLFEFSGACPGCGETPYVKLASQLFGDRMVIANATGCSSIYGGNLPTTPWKKNDEGRGPAWSNSLFEDNAEFGLGFRLSIDAQNDRARRVLETLKPHLDGALVEEVLGAEQHAESQINAQRDRVEKLKHSLKTLDNEDAKTLLELADYLVKKSVWIMGGDGWAYDIGYGGLDHVLASGKNVNVLVLDTQVYSNTGGQQSKATMTGAVAKFAAGGKAGVPKDLAAMAIAYENVYVAKVAMGANDTATVKAFVEAERYDGPSIIIAYSHCVAHGYDLKYGFDQQKRAVDSGLWPIFRFNPDKIKEGENPMTLDYKGPKIDVKDFMYRETRFKMVEKMNALSAGTFLQTAAHTAESLYARYQNLHAYYEPSSKEA
ncbi:MAG: pyruvate:ferredoxin (flavodoxin) oxidoreductase [Sulfuricurvum sp. GWF2_44_89]|uniref:Pyruvate:ferredoxin (Flavodoxin) oxidoreductase n=1 Tax=Sulfuricurvum kujiense TaxID=148813 RepID=A0A2D3WJ45_9BACT|nr:MULTISPECIES: pyruvate:ferredoxin (flavodoxin) oxidoreductase [Sulfuricurvum]OHD78767.1 MAG: pyruvate:ferredoxin (flavodoxin) oxidoreductase [Sulfuricurvum sp. GWF2_44_89]OHD95205.1 MAG: pyruvate:ferredoxin (flavodoxin) oxidoreductase [Sulfuricurvum sp. RIFOXYD12_FULL_44_77]OHD99097.1 MAG: pyruvate:ferredoxin (flavodoxin) oxidoreductase [Sulfuricurvum sp. RIFOXYD2_FULL_44_160]DAB38757.1 MAG TPA: pyruvate:ferredoxin (flavodoxin) oxidoreductase [Sulfuricurvum kujiense]